MREPSFFTQMKSWNQRMNGLPRKGLLIVLSFLAAAAIYVIFPYVWPFLLSLGCAWLMEPLVRRLERGVGKVRVPRKGGTLLGMLLLFGVVGALVTGLLQRLIRELSGLIRSLPQLLQWLSQAALPWLREVYEEYRPLLPESFLSMAQGTLSDLGQTLLKSAASLSASLTSGAFSTAMSIPNVLLSIVVTVMSAYYLTADRQRIMGWFRRTLPSSVQDRLAYIRLRLLRSLFGQLKSQLLVSLIGMVFLTLALMLYGIPYGFGIGVVIGVADALPVLGAGLFLIPWSLFCLIGGDVATGIFIACAYVGIIVIRQILEPRIVGKNLGLYPLLTMGAMYAGYRLLGLIGLLAGPVMISVFRAVLDADAQACRVKE